MYHHSTGEYICFQGEEVNQARAFEKMLDCPRQSKHKILGFVANNLSLILPFFSGVFATIYTSANYGAPVTVRAHLASVLLIY